jgi:hypothetical protein
VNRFEWPLPGGKPSPTELNLEAIGRRLPASSRPSALNLERLLLRREGTSSAWEAEALPLNYTLSAGRKINVWSVQIKPERLTRLIRGRLQS